jgi:hypothetical protein
MSNFWSGLYDNTIGKVLPSAPPDPNKSPAGQAENAFATGLGAQRSNFTNTPAPTVTEGAPPPARPVGSATIGTTVSGARPTTAAGANNHYQAPSSQTVYADPTGLNNQNFALGLDKAAAEGNAPSAADALYRQGTDEAMKNALALAATTQGDNPGMSQRAGEAAATNAELSSTAGAAAQRANEMAQARSDYGTAAGTARGQTLQEAEANQAANLQQQQANNSFYLGLTDEQQKALQAMLGAATANSANQQKYGAANQQFFGGLLSGGGQALGSSGGGAGAAAAA